MLGAMALLRLPLQSALLYGVFWLGSWLVEALRLPLPANLVGLCLLLGLLWAGLVKPSHLDVVSGLVSKHLSFFFVPFAVGLMAWGDLLVSHGLVLGVALLASAALGIGLAGLVAQTARGLTAGSARPAAEAPSLGPSGLRPFPTWSLSEAEDGREVELAHAA